MATGVCNTSNVSFCVPEGGAQPFLYARAARPAILWSCLRGIALISPPEGLRSACRPKSSAVHHVREPTAAHLASTSQQNPVGLILSLASKSTWRASFRHNKVDRASYYLIDIKSQFVVRAITRLSYPLINTSTVNKKGSV